MQKIFKYSLTTGGVLLPVGADILSVGCQGLDLVIWAMIETEETRTQVVPIVVLHTGWDADVPHGKFIGTVQMGNGLVLHVFMGEKNDRHN